MPFTTTCSCCGNDYEADQLPGHGGGSPICPDCQADQEQSRPDFTEEPFIDDQEEEHLVPPPPDRPDLLIPSLDAALSSGGQTEDQIAASAALLYEELTRIEFIRPSVIQSLGELGVATTPKDQIIQQVVQGLGYCTGGHSWYPRPITGNIWSCRVCKAKTYWEQPGSQN